MRKITYRGKIMGFLIKNYKEGSIPQTDKDNPLQVLSWKHKKGFKCEPHTHVPKLRLTRRLNECFVIQKGTVRFRLFDEKRRYFKTLDLKAGDAYMFLRGAHEAEAVTDCEMFEVKNGPFIDDKQFI